MYIIKDVSELRDGKTLSTRRNDSKFNAIGVTFRRILPATRQSPHQVVLEKKRGSPPKNNKQKRYNLFTYQESLADLARRGKLIPEAFCRGIPEEF